MSSKIKNDFKSKTDLIEKVNQNLSDPRRIIGKIIRQTQLFTKSNKIDWSRKIFSQWQKKQISETIDQFLEEINLNLKNKNGVVLNNYFSLKDIVTLARKARNPQTGKEMIIKEQNRKLKKIIN